MEFSDAEKKFLSRLGRNEDGKDLVALFKKAKAHYSSIDSIANTADYGAQVEGRKLFITFVDTLISKITTQEHVSRPLDPEDYE